MSRIAFALRARFDSITLFTPFDVHKTVLPLLNEITLALNIHKEEQVTYPKTNIVLPTYQGFSYTWPCAHVVEQYELHQCQIYTIINIIKQIFPRSYLSSSNIKKIEGTIQERVFVFNELNEKLYTNSNNQPSILSLASSSPTPSTSIPIETNNMKDISSLITTINNTSFSSSSSSYNFNSSCSSSSSSSPSSFSLILKRKSLYHTEDEQPFYKNRRIEN